jgi:RNA polymerase sigma-70 factor, ECF subfamily
VKPAPQIPLRLVPSDETGPVLGQYYRRYGPYVAAVILRLGGHPAELDDLIQDIFVVAIGGIDRLRQPEAIKGWLATIAVRVVRKRLRVRRVRRFFGLEVLSDQEVPVDAAASPVDKLLLRAVFQILDELPVEERLAFGLHHLEGEKLETVARLCGCSCATAKRRIARARRAVEERIGDD